MRAADNKSTLLEIYSNGRSGAPRGTVGVYNSSTFLASSTNLANVQTDVEVWATTGGNTAEVECICNGERREHGQYQHRQPQLGLRRVQHLRQL
jgi:hypothetical protein